TGRLYRIQRESARLRELFNESSLRRLGELLESRYVLTGQVSRLDTLLVLSARLVDAETGEVLSAELVQHRGARAALGASVRELSRKVLAHFPLTGRIVALHGDTLVADIGLADGLLPGQELTVANLAQVGAELDGFTTREAVSVRCRVVDLAESTSSLLPVIRGLRKTPRVGFTVVGPGGADRLSGAGEKRTGNSSSRPAGGVRDNFGKLLIESDPPGALTVLAGMDVGRTPVREAHLRAGRHPVILNLPGYIEVMDSVTVVPGNVEKYKFRLVKQTGRLTIVTAQPDVYVQIDTLELMMQGTGSIIIEDFPAGPHWIEARKPGYETFRETVEIVFPQDSTFEIDLVPHPGSLLIISEPSGAGIFLDGVFTGKVTPWRLTHLEAGAHVLRLSLRGCGASRDTVEITPGRDITIERKLDTGRSDFHPCGMVLIPGGETISPVRGDTVRVEPFYIDIHEVTNRAYSYFVRETGFDAPSHWPGGEPPAEDIEHPVVNVSWEDAARFAAWSGKRLPTEHEWVRASMGGEGENKLRKYPWGDSYRPGEANTWSEALGHTARVGSFPGDRSPFGLFDMVGNVSEWVDSWFDSSTRLYRVYRGGSYYVNDLDPSLASRDGDYPINKNKYTGFRCARDLKVW
ncbi:MAG: SUMF1/EgtB/PvdO family nonheme iron enzyme, partial [Gemmatimonadota bacterium]|nr:SUMF1/EgtB/PvdO family nonheme iron enzyme [Gemmatimonadota bacterium]